MKKIWTRPELVVLVRGSDEERVLFACKLTDATGPWKTCNAGGSCNQISISS
ncbi:MAG: hypothetical protein WB392_14985 [Methanotrichaceae archaeon]